MAGNDPITLVEDPARPQSPRIVLKGRVTVEAVKDLHRTARTAFARGGDVAVCCDGVEYLHAAAVQVLLCLGRDVAKRGGRCVVTGGGAVGDILRLGGLNTDAAGPSGRN